MNAWAIPAPAPWAKTKHACADGGRSISAETAFALSTCSFNSCGLRTFISRVWFFLQGFEPDRKQLGAENPGKAQCAGGSLPQHRMVVQQIFADRWSLNRAEQDLPRFQVVRRHAKAHDLAERGIAQEIV